MKLNELMLASVDMVSEGTMTVTVLLDGNAPAGGVKVLLGTSHSELMVPRTVTVPSGQSQVSFIMGAGVLTPLIKYQLWAQVQETIIRQQVVLRLPGLAELAFSPTIVNSNDTVSLRVSLDSVAPATGALIYLSEVLNYGGVSTPMLTDLPASVAIEGLLDEVTIELQVANWDGGRMPPPRETQVAVDARYGNVTRRAILTVIDP